MVEIGLMDRAARSTVVLALQSGVNALLGTLLFMYVARVLTKTEMGVYGTVTLILSVTMIIGRLGLDTTASRFISHLYGSENPEGAGFVAKRILCLSAVSTSILSGLCFAFSPLLSKLMLGNYQYAYLFQVASFALFTAIISLMFSAFIQGLQMFSHLALILLASQIVRVTITVLLLTLAFSIEALILGSIAFNLLIIVLGLPPALSRLLRKNNSDFPHPIKRLLSFALPMTGYELVGYVYNSVDQFFVLNLIGVEALGVYTVALTAASLTLTVMGGPLLKTLTPRLSEAHGRVGLKSVANALKPTSRYISLFFIPATFGLAALSPSAIRVLAGHKYVEASLPMIIMCLGVATYGFSAMMTSALIAAGKTGRIMEIMFIASIVSLPLTVSLTQLFGVLGAASARTLMYLLLLALSIYLGSRVMSISFDNRAIAGSLASSTLMAIIIYTIASHTGFSLTLLPLYITLGLIVYGLTLSTMRIPTLHDVQFITQTIPGGKRIYIKLYGVVKDSRFLSKVTRLLLNI